MAETPTETPEPVSFTDTNAETGMTGKGNAATSSNMMELVGQLKRGKQAATADTGSSKSSRGGGKKGKKNKKKKKKKGTKTKTKYKRRHDRYEPENYLLRVEGSICCAFLISVLLFLLYNGLIILIIVIYTGAEFHHLHMKEKLTPETATSAPATSR